MVWRVTGQRGSGIVCRVVNHALELPSQVSSSRWSSNWSQSGSVSAALEHPEKIGQPRELYKVLIRSLDRLPHPDSKFYKDSVRRGFSQHVDETDPERVRQIIERSVQDVKWVLQKYKLS